jgi:hypothetical protein
MRQNRQGVSVLTEAEIHTVVPPVGADRLGCCRIDGYSRLDRADAAARLRNYATETDKEGCDDQGPTGFPHVAWGKWDYIRLLPSRFCQPSSAFERERARSDTNLHRADHASAN